MVKYGPVMEEAPGFLPPLTQPPQQQDGSGQPHSRKHGQSSSSSSLGQRPPGRGESRQTQASSPADPLLLSPPDDTAPESPATSPHNAEPTLAQIMEAIQHSHSSLTVQMDSIKSDLSFLKHDVHTLRHRVTNAEQRIGDLEDETHPLQGSVRELRQAQTYTADKLTDMEDRLRRNNLRFLGFPEGSEGRDPEAFMERWLITTFGASTFSRLFAIERAHRVPLRPLPSGAPPRAILIKLLHFRDREAVLRAAREKGRVAFNGNGITIFPDFSAATQKQRATFLGIKKRLRELNLPYGMLYPARLRIIYQGKAHFFTDPKEASHWVDTLGHPDHRDQNRRPPHH